MSIWIHGSATDNFAGHTVFEARRSGRSNLLYAWETALFSLAVTNQGVMQRTSNDRMNAKTVERSALTSRFVRNGRGRRRRADPAHHRCGRAVARSVRSDRGARKSPVWAQPCLPSGHRPVRPR
jgi:hypothetical protein